MAVKLQEKSLVILLQLLSRTLQIPTLVCVHVCMCGICAEASARHSLEREIELVVNSVSHLVTDTSKPQAHHPFAPEDVGGS